MGRRRVRVPPPSIETVVGHDEEEGEDPTPAPKPSKLIDFWITIPCSVAKAVPEGDDDEPAPNVIARASAIEIKVTALDHQDAVRTLTKALQQLR